MRAVNFFPDVLTFTVGEWRGLPFALEEWQARIVYNLFGWKRPNGMRRYREGFIYIPRKNGKSEWAAGLGLLLEFADGEPAAQVYCAAADKDQAKIVFRAGTTMVEQSPELSERGRVYHNSIAYKATGSFLMAISAEAYSKHGMNAHGIIMDELHAQPNRDLVDVLMTSVGSRRQPLTIHITTADFDRESICNEKYDYACKVRDGVVDDPSFLPVIYEATLDDDWTSPDVWRKANPNYGVSVKEDYLAAECKRAQETPTYENTFKRLHLNIKTQQDVRWIKLEQWDACDSTPIDPDALARETCYAGLDLSSTTDISSLVLAFRDEDGGVILLPYFWIPSDNAHQRERRDRVPYLTWARQGYVELTPGNVIDYARIKAKIDELYCKYHVAEVAIDRWNSSHITSQLQDEGVTVIGFGQGYKDMSPAAKEFEKLVVCGKLRHGGNPVLRWMASHVAAESDAAGNIKPSKKRSTERIDGIVAAVMAIARLDLAGPPPTDVSQLIG